MRSLLSSLNTVSVIGLVFSSARMLIGATSAVFLLSKGITASDIGIMKSVQAMLLMLIEFPLGLLADLKGRRICLILGSAAGAAWLALTAIGSEFWVLLLAECLNAISLASFNGAFDALLAEKYIARQGRPMLNRLLGDYHAVLFAVMALFSLVGGTFVPPASSTFWWIASFLLILLTALIPFLVRDEPGRSRVESRGVGGHLKSFFCSELASVWQQIWTNKEIRILAIPFVLIGVFNQLLIPYWQIFFVTAKHARFTIAGFELSVFGPLFFFILLIQSAASKALGIGRLFNCKSRALLGLISLSALSLTATSAVQSPLILSVVSILVVFGVIRFYLLQVSAHLHNLMDDARRASVLSALSVLTRIILVLVLPLSGYAIERFGIWFLPLFGCCVAGLLFVAGIAGRTFGARFDGDEFHLTQS